MTQGLIATTRETGARPPAPRTAGLMSAAVIAAPGRVELVRVPRPEPAHGQVRVRVDGCGVCTSNLPVWEGRPWFSYPLAPGQPGHEAWGMIEKLGEGVCSLSVGMRVTLLATDAYAEYVACPAEAVVALPDCLSNEPVPGEPLACAFNVLARSDIRAGQTVAIVGIGFLGALLTRLASAAGARVIAVSRRPFALEMARRMGAAEAIALARRETVCGEVQGLTDGRGCERVIEAVGQQEALDLATDLTAERGRLVVAGYHQDGLRQVNMQVWNWRGLDVINAHERDPQVYMRGMRAAIAALAAGAARAGGSSSSSSSGSKNAVESNVFPPALDPTPLYTHRLPLRALGDALELARQRPDAFMKALVTMPGEEDGG